MANAALAILNHVDLSTTVLTALGQLTTAPVSYLQDPHVGKKWRHNATATWVDADLASAKSIDTVMLAGVSGTNPAFRVRLGTASGLGDVFDSGSISGLPYYDPDYQMFVYLLTSPLSARWIRVDISEAAVSYIEAGREFIGIRNVFTTNYQPGWQRTLVSGSDAVVGVNGQTYFDLRAGYTRQTFQFDFATETEWSGFVDDIITITKNLGHLDMLWCKDTASSNLSRDCIWGYQDSDFTATQALQITPQLYSLSFSIRQRL